MLKYRNLKFSLTVNVLSKKLKLILTVECKNCNVPNLRICFIIIKIRQKCHVDISTSYVISIILAKSEFRKLTRCKNLLIEPN